MTRFRLLADDLTGALDSAARFCPMFGPVPVAWADDPAETVLALDSMTRDANAGAARVRADELAPALAGAELAFKKLDSLLRGHVALEVAACQRAGRFDAVVIAPAFPAQGRITRDGRQLAHGSDVGLDIGRAFADEGIHLAHRRPGDDLPPGVSLWDAETDDDLMEIAAMRRRRVLWCGTAGLAGALARQEFAPRPAPQIALARPIVALIGSDHPVALAQLAACHMRVVLGVAAAEIVDGAAVSVALPAGTDRALAAGLIGAEFAQVLARLPRPGTLVVTGGETLRRVCAALDARGLVVEGELAPGVPVSRLAGGRWDGARIVSKSGAFGDARLLARLLEGTA